MELSEARDERYRAYITFGYLFCLMPYSHAQGELETTLIGYRWGLTLFDANPRWNGNYKFGFEI